jgi:hypothetical protein
VISKQQLGKHKLRVQAPGYDPFEDEVDVHFQKVAGVEVRLLVSKETIGSGKFQTIERKPFYTRTWFIVTVFAVAIGAGILIGRGGGQVECIDGATGMTLPSC